VRRGVALLLAAAGLLAATPPAQAATWGERRQAAIRYLQTRQGIESFAFAAYGGTLHGYRRWRVVPSASLLKAMLLVAYLNKSSVRARDLTDDERRLLGPMIRWSDNDAAGIVLGRVGETRLNRLAERVGMVHFRLRSPWGLSEVTAGDQARFFFRIDKYVVAGHRPYARRLLRTIVPSQRWGMPPAVPSGWTIFFKGGWGTGTGRVTHQSALLQNGSTRLAISVLTEWNPSHAYGTATIRGIAARLLRVPLPTPPQ
jgi:beta-lactamase class A